MAPLMLFHISADSEREKNNLYEVNQPHPSAINVSGEREFQPADPEKSASACSSTVQFQEIDRQKRQI
jgi:hypothetical protein